MLSQTIYSQKHAQMHTDVLPKLRREPSHKKPYPTQPKAETSALAHTEPKPFQQGLTEILVSQEDARHTLEMVMPMLAHLSKQTENRWLTWLTPVPLRRELLSGYDFDLNKVRTLCYHSCKESQELFKQTLANGNSATVICTLDKLSKTLYKQLEHASKAGNSRGLAFRVR